MMSTTRLEFHFKNECLTIYALQKCFRSEARGCYICYEPDFEKLVVLARVIALEVERFGDNVVLADQSNL